MARHHRLGPVLSAGILVLGLVACGDDDEAVQPDAADVLEDDAGTGDDTGGSDGDDVGDPVEIPDTIPLPEEHEIVEAIGNPDAGYTIMLTSALGLEEAIGFYEAELPEAGWSGVARREMGADAVMVEAARPADDHSFAVRIRAEGDGTSLQIFTGPPG